MTKCCSVNIPKLQRNKYKNEFLHTGKHYRKRVCPTETDVSNNLFPSMTPKKTYYYFRVSTRQSIKITDRSKAVLLILFSVFACFGF